MSDEQVCHARILIVDDELANVRLLERMLQRKGYTNFWSITDSREVSTHCAEIQPDLILLDLFMPNLDGYAVLEQLAPLLSEGNYLPVLVLTADISLQARQRVLSMGAKDFLTKPLNTTEVLLRIKNLLETRLLHRELQYQNQILEARVRERTRDLELAQIEILTRLARAAEFVDDDSGLHTQRVGRLAARLAHALQLPERQVELIRWAAPLHDLGKIGVPAQILRKQGVLTDDEQQQIRDHPMIGASILMGSSFLLLQLAEEIALTHHERWDGSGYPRGLIGEQIPFVGRIVAVADTFDAISSYRHYRNSRSTLEALNIIQQQSGILFDPQVVSALLQLAQRENGLNLEDE